MTQEQYRQQMAYQAAQAQQRAQTQNGVNAAQTDGAGDDIVESIGIIKGIDAQGSEVMMGRVEIDGLIRGKIEAMGQSMEGGGLMLPLHKVAKSKKRQRKSKSSASFPQHDGPGSDDDDEDSKDNVKDEELDEDAINSDLDDPDDGLNDEEDDEETMGHIMLCMYDKVQRVKNKWFVSPYSYPSFRSIHFANMNDRKCVMKDGVLTVNGKEYVFHKASGEYEW